MALLEEASKARSGLARDDYDAGRWKNEMDDARERLTASRTTVINTVDDGAPNPIDTSKTLATNSAPIVPKTNETATQIAPISNQPKPEKVETPKIETPKPETVAKNEPIEPPKIIEIPKPEVTEPIKNDTQETSSRDRRVGKQEPQKQAETVAKTEAPKVETQPTSSENTAKSDSPIQVGSLIDYATSKVAPTYPPAAKTMRMTGTVKVEVLVNEDGSIAEVQKTSGPSMLQRAAVDALKKWKFKPFVKDGQAVKASGFVSFNFNL
jgi:protein TonB